MGGGSATSVLGLHGSAVMKHRRSLVVLACSAKASHEAFLRLERVRVVGPTDPLTNGQNLPVHFCGLVMLPSLTQNTREVVLRNERVKVVGP